MKKYKECIFLICLFIVLRVYLPDGTIKTIECEKVDISHSELNVRSMFNHFSNLRELLTETKTFTIDLYKPAGGHNATTYE